MNPLLNGMNDRQAEAVQTTEGPLWSWRELVLVRHVSWPTGSLTWSMKKWSILGIFWPLPLPIKPLGDERASLPVKSSHPRLLDRHLPLHVCVSFDAMRIILATIAILPLSIQVSNGPWWSGFWSPWTWILKMEWTDHLGTISNAKMTWSMKWPMLPRLEICIPRSLLSAMRLIKRNSVSQKQWTLMIWSCWPCVFWSASRCADLLPAEVPIHPRRRVSRYQPCPIPVGQTLGFTL